MATVNKDFKIKQGLVVEGATATVNGNQVLTETASDQYIIDLIGGETLVTSVNSTQLEVVDGELSVKSGVFDADGAADTAEQNAKTYADGLAVNYDAAGSAAAAQTAAELYADGLAPNYDAAGSATTAYNDAVTYADGLAVNYDAAGSASTAETNANNYTDNKVLDYTKTSDLDTTIDGYGYLKSADLNGYATETYVNDAVADLVNGAPELLDTLNELAAAIGDDANYATTVSGLIADKQNNLTAGSNIDITSDTISVTGLTTQEVMEGSSQGVPGPLYFTDQRALDATSAAYDAAGSAFDAQQNAEGYTDAQLTNYTTTANLETTIDGYGFAYTSELPTSSDDLSEGVNNLYYSNGRVLDAVDLAIQGGTQTNISVSYNTLTQKFDFVAENGVADSTTDDLAEGEENLYFTDERAIDAVSAADIYPNAVIINNLTKQVANQVTVASAGTATGISWVKADYRSAEFVVKVAYGDHTEISKVLLTLDVNDNISITEYGNVTTNGSASTISADISGTDARLRVTTVNNNSTVTVLGTLIA